MFAVLLLVAAAAGWVGAPWWFPLLAGAALSIETWWTKLNITGRHRGLSWSNKITTYFITGIFSNVALAAGSYGLGWLLRCYLVA
jgi:hypothetical protein